MSLSEMIVRPRFTNGEISRWTVEKGSRKFEVNLGSRGDWETFNHEDLMGDDYVIAPVLNVSGDLSGSLEYIEGLFR